MGCNTSKESIQQAVDEAKEDVKETAKDITRDLLKEETREEAKNGDVPKSAETVAADDSEPKESNDAAEEHKEEHTEEPTEEPKEDGAEEDPDDSDKGKLEEAATRIQAVFRGHTVRKTLKDTDSSKEEKEESTAEQPEQQEGEELYAASKIQSSLRGHMSRKVEQAANAAKELAENAVEKIDEKVTDAVNELEGIDLSDPDLHKAATKIQASFRGHKVRQEIPITGVDEKEK